MRCHLERGAKATLEDAPRPPVEEWWAENEDTNLFRSVLSVCPSSSINDGQIRCQAGPSVHKTADGRLYRDDSVRDNDTSVQSQLQARRAAGRDPAGGESPMTR